ncbi:hypothetical protein ONZ45_g9685 [Pleurotus djamor]|nr:hypothetical protein ONZ45_g9685 [Pleurotus djamor]
MNENELVSTNDVGELPTKKLNGPLTISDVTRVNNNACKCFATFCKGYKRYRAKRWNLVKRWKQQPEEELYCNVIDQGKAYIAVVRLTIDISDNDRAICRTVVSMLESGDPLKKILPHVTMKGSLVQRHAREVEKKLRKIRGEILQIRRNQNAPESESKSADQTEQGLPQTERTYADLAERVAGNLADFTIYFLDEMLTAIDAFVDWWDNQTISILAISIRMNAIKPELAEEDLEAVANQWKGVERDYAAYLAKIKVEQDFVEATLRGLN